MPPESCASLGPDVSAPPSVAGRRTYEDLDALGAVPHPFRPVPLRHTLARHPLLSLPALHDLASRLSPAQIQYNRGDLPPQMDRRLVPDNGLSPEATLAEIEACQSWMVLKNVQTDPAYAELLNGCLDEIQAASLGTCPGMHQRECYIFVTSPGSVTPLHMDPEHNVLHQIRGEKTIHLWDAQDARNLSDEQLEFFYTAENCRDFQMPELKTPHEAYTIRAGEALYFPLEAPHWVQNGNAVSISLSTTWRSAYSERKVSIHQFNAKLRRRGLRPQAFGASRRRDSAKYATMRMLRGVKRVVRPG